MEFIRSKKVGFFFALLIVVIQKACGQEGFVSLRCCSQSNYTDPDTNLTWITDNGDFLRSTCRNVSLPVSNDTSYKQARVFDEDSVTKWCYNLTTIKQRNYLIRGTFLHGPILRSSPTTNFNVLIGATMITRVISSVDSLEEETVLRATKHYINFCLVRVEGNPYISKLELRPLNDYDQYFENDPSGVLKLVSRVDLGNTQRPIRFPTDRNDRIWTVDSNPSVTPVALSPGTNISIFGANPSIPTKVLQTAVTDTDHLQFLYNDFDNVVVVFLYFLELNSSVTVGQRVFNIHANGVRVKENFDILENSTSNYREVFFNIDNSNGSLNISLTKASTALLGPICNAYEIFQVHKKVVGTREGDVDAIVGVRDELLVTNRENLVLGSWTGDPCLPSPWKGVACEPKNEISVITKLDLSSNGLQGSLPTIISALVDLKELNVRDNDFMGSIPETLSTLQHLTSLSFGCNRHLNTQLPPGLFNRSHLSTDSGRCSNQVSSSPQTHCKFIIGTVLGGSFLFLLVGLLFTYAYKRVRHPNLPKPVLTKNAVFSVPSMDDIEFKPIFIQTFTLKCIETATNKYKTMIGEGGFGAVYRGTLPQGQEVAVKVRSATSTQGTREFENELNLLSAIRHENLVPLLGYCCESDQQILVYPYMSNGSLQDRLYGDASKRKPLDWQTRLSIALGAARGLLYLHTFAGRSVIHRDVKSSNILMDHSMCAKVADFGFSKYAPQEGDSAASLEVRGTAGYLDPEYYSTQQLSSKSDVFSFGVVLLEIITGREPLNIHRPRNEWSLTEWAKPFIRESRIEEIVDPNIKSGYYAEAMWRVVEVALCCIEPFSVYRPCMADIVRELEDALIIENNASEYMKSIESLGSNRFFSIDRKVLPPTPTPSEPSPIPQSMAPPQPR